MSQRINLRYAERQSQWLNPVCPVWTSNYLSSKTSSTALAFSYLEFLLGMFPFFLPPPPPVPVWCFIVACYHGWWKDCQLFILPLRINPSSAHRKSQTPGLAQIGSSWAFPPPLKATPPPTPPPPRRFYSSVSLKVCKDQTGAYLFKL